MDDSGWRFDIWIIIFLMIMVNRWRTRLPSPSFHRAPHCLPCQVEDGRAEGFSPLSGSCTAGPRPAWGRTLEMVENVSWKGIWEYDEVQTPSLASAWQCCSTGRALGSLWYGAPETFSHMTNMYLMNLRLIGMILMIMIMIIMMTVMMITLTMMVMITFSCVCFSLWFGMLANVFHLLGGKIRI